MGRIAVRTEQFSLATAGDTEVLDITSCVAVVVEQAGVANGQALAFVRGSTAAIATMEFELVLIDFDDRPRERTVVVQVSD